MTNLIHLIRDQYHCFLFLTVFLKKKKTMYYRLKSFLEKHNILYDSQYGFREKRSTEQALCNIINQIETNMDGKHGRYKPVEPRCQGHPSVLGRESQEVEPKKMQRNVNFMHNFNFSLRPIVIGNNTVEWVNTYKLLGVIISDDLKWTHHIEYASKKPSKRLNSLRILRRVGVDSDSILKAYSQLSLRRTPLGPA